MQVVADDDCAVYAEQVLSALHPCAADDAVHCRAKNSGNASATGAPYFERDSVWNEVVVRSDFLNDIPIDRLHVLVEFSFALALSLLFENSLLFFRKRHRHLTTPIKSQQVS